jgi:ATP:ADP antiporter, AAA family
MNLFEVFNNRDQSFKNNLWFFLIAYFMVLFNYSMVRAVSTTLFFEAFGAKSSPVALFWSVIFLSLAIFCCNQLQKYLPVQKVFLCTSLLSAFVFLCSGWVFQSGFKEISYVSFIWKEIYIVIQVHLLLAYANVTFSREDFRMLVGPVGAAGSLGGILGGLLTSSVSAKYGSFPVLWTGILFIVLPSVFFLLTPSRKKEDVEKKSPLGSLNTQSIRHYVFYIAAIVALTQFMINILDFKFNLAFEAAIPDTSSRTAYLGTIYTWTNFLTFFLQVIALPLLLPRVSERNYHLFIPVSYLVSVIIMMMSGESAAAGIALFSVASVYIYVKASDYSLFSAGKELLYQPLIGEQKYGAKYLTDMLVYRSAKALVAVVLIYLQSSLILNSIMIILLILWMGLVIRLFRYQRFL